MVNDSRPHNFLAPDPDTVSRRVLNIGLELDTRNVEQTKDVRMYIEEFILVEIWIHWS